MIPRAPYRVQPLPGGALLVQPLRFFAVWQQADGTQHVSRVPKIIR